MNFGMQPIRMRVRSTADEGFISPFIMERVQIWKHCFRDGKQHGYNPDYSSSHTNLHQCMGCLDLHWPYYSFIPKKEKKKKKIIDPNTQALYSCTSLPFRKKTQTKSFFIQDCEFFSGVLNFNVFNRFLILNQSYLSWVHSVSCIDSHFI